MNWLLIAGAAFIGTQATPTDVEISTVDMYNHTLRGEKVLAKEVVCRNMWGTPMLPNGKGGYSLIAPINQEFISFSLVQPPKTDGGGYLPFFPKKQVIVESVATE